MSTIWMGVGLALIFGWKSIKEAKSNKKKTFVCGHCQSKDTLKIQKLRNRNVFTCSFCERIIDEDQLKTFYKEEYEAKIKEAEKLEKSSREDN